MADTPSGHITEEILEAYSLGQMSDAEVAPVEEHLLVCPDCQDRLQASDLFVATIRYVLRGPGTAPEISREDGSRRKG